MDTKSIMRIVKKSIMIYHTVIVHIRQPKRLPKAYDMELYEYWVKDDQETLYGYDINEKEYKEIIMSSIIDVVDTGKTFIPKHSSHSILEYDGL